MQQLGLVPGLRDMMRRGVITEESAPDDFEWLVRSLLIRDVEIAGAHAIKAAAEAYLGSLTIARQLPHESQVRRLQDDEARLRRACDCSLTSEITERLRDALALCENGDFKNDVTDQSGRDEGEYRASEMTTRLRALIGDPS